MVCPQILEKSLEFRRVSVSAGVSEFHQRRQSQFWLVICKKAEDANREIGVPGKDRIADNFVFLI